MGKEMMRGIVAFASGGLLVFGLIVGIQLLVGQITRVLIYFRLDKKKEGKVVMPRKDPQNHKMESFAYAVNGLSDAFFAMSQPKKKRH